MTHQIRFLFLCLLSTGLLQAQRAPGPSARSDVSAVQKSAQGNTVQTITPTGPVNALGQSLYSHGDPTDQEQYLLELINRARANPPAEGDSLYNTKDADVLNNYSYWKVDKAGVRSAFKTYPSRPPLAFHPKAIDAARVHSNDMASNHYQDHTGTDGSNPGQRLVKAGYPNGTPWGENIFAYAHSMWEAECGFLVDWGTGNEALGHRHNTINFASDDIIYTEIGIGVVAGSGSVGPWVVTEDFGQRTVYYITGVVYKDKNNNGQYDPGEGLSGVTVTPSTGDYYAVTSSSGGYAIPTTATGNIFVSAAGNGITGSKSISLTGKANVKVDFNQSSTPSVILSYPIDQSSVNGDSARVGWNKLSTATLYHLQVSLSPTFSKLLVNDSAIAVKDTSYMLHNLLQDSVYYWRVRAKSSLGWGDFVPPFQFNAVIVPSTVQLLYPEQGAKLKDKNITFKWSQSKPGVAKYWFEIARDSAFTDYALNVYDDLVDTTWTLDDIDGTIGMDTTYYWHVAGFHDNSVQSAFSPSHSFIISDVQNSVNEDKVITVSAFGPNPVNSTVVLRYQLAVDGDVSLSLCDERGQQLRMLNADHQTAGEHFLSLDFTQAPLAQLQSGAYLLQFHTAGGTSTRKIVLQR